MISSHRIEALAAETPAADLEATLRVAEEYGLRGLDEEAESLLLPWRRRALLAQDGRQVAAVEAALAEFALLTHNDARASLHLAAARQACAQPDLGTRARLWLVERALRPGALTDDAQEGELTQLLHMLVGGAAERDLASRLHATASAACLLRQDVSAAVAHAEQAFATAESGSYAQALALSSLARCSATQKQWRQASQRLLEAIAIMLRLGLGRAAARAELDYAVLVAEQVDQPPARFLGRARRNFAGHASWRDLARLRAGFRQHGRRLADRVLSATVERCVERLGATTGMLRAAVASALDQADRALALPQSGELSIAPNVEPIQLALAEIGTRVNEDGRQIEAIGGELVDAAGAALVARNRMRALLDELPRLDACADLAGLGEAAATAAQRLLQADRVVVARKLGGGEQSELGRAQPALATIDAAFERAWRAAVAEGPLSRRPASEEPPSRRAPESLDSADLAVHTKASGIELVLYADKQLRDGRFGAQDRQLARLLCDYLALALAHLFADDARGAAIDRLSATLDAIHDGVVSVDEAGLVTNLNRSAARMLCLDPQAVLGTDCRRHDVLRPLWRLVERGERNDDVRVHIAAAQFLVSVRTVVARGGAGGSVISLTELGRATRIAQRLTAVRPLFTFEDVVTADPAMHECLDLARQAAGLDASVLITGESGVGKELIAQAIHSGGPRRQQPFIAINCAAVPRELLEAELFGYEAGAFTGARADGRLGKFELAGRGTILLDEIGDMPLDMQAKLLRVLQERSLTRLGGAQEYPLFARVIATTHRDLEDMVDRRLFRHDLLFRLRVLHLQVPPLRERGADVLLIAQHLLSRLARAQHKRVEHIGGPVRDLLMQHPWPGNVRELANVIEREVSLLDADESELTQLRMPPGRRRSTVVDSDLVPPSSQQIVPLRQLERSAFMHALKLSGYNVPQAARALGVSKVTFYAKLRRWGLHPADHNKTALERMWARAAEGER